MESKKGQRVPADLQRLSSWQQGWLKALVGLAFVLTVYQFLQPITMFSSMINFMPIGMVILYIALMSCFTFAWPFLIGLALIFVAVAVMDASAEKNLEKLKGMLDKAGYDTKPRKLQEILFSK